MKSTANSSGISRRRFIAAAGAAIAAPTIIPSSALGRDGAIPPSERIVMGVVGWGMQGPGNTNEFLGQKDCQVVAACDLDKKHLKQAADTINKRYDNQDCKTYHDYREMFARTDIDAVMLAVPDNWHALVAIEAARQKKDIYGEKPLARTIAEQQAIVKAVQANGRIWQTGSWQRSVANFHKGAEIVRNGLIGKVHHVEVGLPAGHNDFAGTKDKLQVSEPPAELDYAFWIGPAKMEPYIEGRVHKNWRWNYNIGGGQLLDWIGHHCDIAHWGLGFDLNGPYEIVGEGEFPPAERPWNTCTKYRITLKYPDDITMTIAGGHPDIKSGTKWIGSGGFVRVDRGGFDASNADWRRSGDNLPEDLRKVKLYESANHWRNFLDCVRSRQPAIAPVETAHHSAIPGHLGLISMLAGDATPIDGPNDEKGWTLRKGRKLQWDVQKEVIVGDATASKFMDRPYRAPWEHV